MEWTSWGCFLFFGLLAGYAAGVAQTRRYHRRIFDDMMERFEERAMCYLIEKSEWIDRLRASADHKRP